MVVGPDIAEIWPGVGQGAPLCMTVRLLRSSAGAPGAWVLIVSAILSLRVQFQTFNVVWRNPTLRFSPIYLGTFYLGTWMSRANTQPEETCEFNIPTGLRALQAEGNSRRRSPFLPTPSQEGPAHRRFVEGLFDNPKKGTHFDKTSW